MDNKTITKAGERTHVNGLIAREAIQCSDAETGKTGSFLYSGDDHRAKGARVSPVCADLINLYAWARLNGWEHVGDAFVFKKG